MRRNRFCRPVRCIFMMRDNKWAQLLAYITGLVNQRLLLQCEYLVAENRILRSRVAGRLHLSDAERSTLAEIAKRVGRRHLAEVACIAKPDTILAWYRRLIACKFDGSIRGAHASIVQSKSSSSAWPRRTPFGLQADRRRIGQPRSSHLRSDDRKHSEAARHRPGAETQPKHELEGLHFGAHGGPGWHGFLHGRGPMSLRPARWVRSVKEECLSKLILFGESSLRRALTEFVAHYHSERNHQGKGNSLPSPPR
jgi:hypothetical protein